MRYRFHTADVFTRTVFGGNPLAVLPDARGLGTEQMKKITREFNYSETVFVLPAEDPAHTRKLRIFTPGRELPFAGHPTVGTAVILARIGEIPSTGATTRIVFEEGVGSVPVTIRATDGQADFAQLTAARLPEIGPPPPDRKTLADLLSLDESDLADGAYDAEAVSCGVPFLFIALRDRAALARIRIERPLFDAALAHFWATEIYVLAFDPELPGSDLRARMFAPSLGIAEDPATGAAATALAGYLAKRDLRRDGTLRWVVEQGFEMGRPSLLEVEADVEEANGVTAIRVGGAAVLVSEGTIEVPG
jgi:trans-2,3-dihydro-3-hydroxyanthranilate isomerase